MSCKNNLLEVHFFCLSQQKTQINLPYSKGFHLTCNWHSPPHRCARSYAHQSPALCSMSIACPQCSRAVSAMAASAASAAMQPPQESLRFASKQSLPPPVLPSPCNCRFAPQQGAPASGKGQAADRYACRRKSPRACCRMRHGRERPCLKGFASSHYCERNGKKYVSFKRISDLEKVVHFHPTTHSAQC